MCEVCVEAEELKKERKIYKEKIKLATTSLISNILTSNLECNIDYSENDTKDYIQGIIDNIKLKKELVGKKF